MLQKVWNYSPASLLRRSICLVGRHTKYFGRTLFMINRKWGEGVGSNSYSTTTHAKPRSSHAQSSKKRKPVNDNQETQGRGRCVACVCGYVTFAPNVLLSSRHRTNLSPRPLSHHHSTLSQWHIIRICRSTSSFSITDQFSYIHSKVSVATYMPTQKLFLFLFLFTFSFFFYLVNVMVPSTLTRSRSPFYLFHYSMSYQLSRCYVCGNSCCHLCCSTSPIFYHSFLHFDGATYVCGNSCRGAIVVLLSFCLLALNFGHTTWQGNKECDITNRRYAFVAFHHSHAACH